MRRVNRAVTNRLMSPIATFMPPLAVVHHVGRKSGRAYRTPVLAFPMAGGYVTPLPYGTDTDWCRNLVEAGKGSFERLGRQISVGNPRIVGADAAVPLLPAPLRPGLRLASLPGYLLVDRAPSAARRKKRAKRPGRRDRHR
jgi:deazaflavin-dependent oxidoreductase (nitroreductase family)